MNRNYPEPTPCAACGSDTVGDTRGFCRTCIANAQLDTENGHRWVYVHARDVTVCVMCAAATFDPHAYADTCAFAPIDWVTTPVHHQCDACEHCARAAIIIARALGTTEASETDANHGARVVRRVRV